MTYKNQLCTQHKGIQTLDAEEAVKCFLQDNPRFLFCELVLLESE